MSFLFGLCFIGHTSALTNEIFTVVDSSHWVLSVGDKFADLASVRDVCLFLNTPTSLPPDQALCLYIKTGNDWSYRGAIHVNHVSEVFPLQWTEAALRTKDAGIGICVEPMSEVQGREATIVGSKATFAKRVAMNLYTFMGSFGTTQNGNQLLVPANVFEKYPSTRLPSPDEVISRWLTRFEAKFSRDPDFLTREDNVI